MRNEEQETFSALGVSPDLVAVLDDAGLTTPFPVQRLCIPDALAGRDVCGKAKTGSGKTLAFGLPLVERVARPRPEAADGPRARPHPRAARVQVTDVLRPLVEARDLRLVAVYGGAQMSKQIDGARGRRRDRGGHARPAHRPDRPQGRRPRRRRPRRPRRGRPDGRHGVPAPGRVGAAPHQAAATRPCCSRPRSTARIQGLVDRYQHDPVFHEVGLAHPDGRARWPTASCWSTRWTSTGWPPPSAARARGAWCSPTPSGPPTGWPASSRTSASTPRPSTATCARRCASGRSSASPTGKLAVLVATDVAARGLDIDELDIVIQADPPPEPKTYLHRSGPHRPGRRRRPGGHARAVERGARGAPAEAPPRPRRAHRRDVLERRAPRRPHLLEPGRRGRGVADRARGRPSRGQILVEGERPQQRR